MTTARQEQTRPNRPPKRRTISTEDDLSTRLVRQAHRYQDRIRVLRLELRELHSGFKSTDRPDRLPHPTGVDPQGIIGEITRLENQVARMLAAIGNDP